MTAKWKYEYWCFNGGAWTVTAGIVYGAWREDARTAAGERLSISSDLITVRYISTG